MKRTILATLLLWAALFTANGQPVGVCTSLRNAEKAKNAGCDFLEPTVGDVLMPGKSEDEFQKVLAQYRSSPLSIRSFVNFFPGEIRLTGDNADHQAALKWAETAFRRAEKAGVGIIVLGSGNSRRIPDGYDYRKATAQFVSLLKAMGPLAAQHNVIVAIEHLNSGETNFFNTLAEGVRIVRKVNHPNIRCLCDIYHMARENESPASIRKARKYIVHVHVAENNDRAAPGVHNEDLRPYYRALRQIGYTGGVSMECRWKNFTDELAPAVGTIRQQWSTAAE